MVLWQATVLAIQILLLVLSWALYQQAKAELSARAAETPILSEVKALQKNVKALLSEIESTADRTGSRLEDRCRDAKELLGALEREIQMTRDATAAIAALRSLPASTYSDNISSEPGLAVSAAPVPASGTLMHTGGEPQPTQDITHPSDNLGQMRQSTTISRPTDDRRKKVYALADAGETTSAIASATQLSEGEIETLLGLRHQRREP